MEKLPESHFEQALELMQLGYKLVVLKPRSKRPLHKGWQERHYDQQELELLLQRDGCNLGIKTGGPLIILDIDSTQQEKIDFIVENVGDTPMKVRSPSGGQHLYYRTRAGVHYGNGVKLRGEPYDLRWDGCFIVCPPSISAEGTAYQRIGEPLPVEDLPIIKISPLRQRKRTRKERVLTDTSDRTARTASAVRNILHPEAYCLKIPSLQGHNGSAALVRVVCILRDAGRTSQQAWEFLSQKWNPHCAVPLWSAEELLHAIARHYDLKR